MAITEPNGRIDDFTNYYEQCVTKMLGATGAQANALANIAKSFENLGLSTEQQGILLGELAVQTSVQFNKDATNAALEIIKLEPDFELKSAQRDVAIAQAKFTDRQTQGYDDNMLLKLVEEQGGLASFAVNAGSDSAQTAINSLKEKMSQVEARVLPLSGLPQCPTPTPITPVPSGLIPSLISATSITISWNPVSNATSYLVYRDGLLVATSGSLNFTSNELTPNTKYAFSVKASINGELSDHTNALVVTTDVEG